MASLDKIVVEHDITVAETSSSPAARTAVLAREGDDEGAAVRRQITAAVEALQRARRPDEAVN